MPEALSTGSAPVSGSPVPGSGSETPPERSSSDYAEPKPAGQRLPFWVLGSVVIGFLLPVCACVLLTLTGLVGLGTLGAGAGGGSGPIPVSRGSGPAVAVVRIEGTISSNDEPDNMVGAASGRVRSDLAAAVNDASVRAIVLRVDSPGGSVTGSAQIYEALLAIEKPVVVSMAGTAASGGYYVSMAADYLFARPDTFTGSLGVIMTVYNAADLAQELGIDVVHITSDNNKALGSLWQDLTPEQTAILQALVDESYEEFVRIVVAGRDLSEERVRELADGRIYSGRQALALGLVDELGDFDAAVARAAELGGITGDPRIIEYERVPSLNQFLTGLGGRLRQREVDQLLATFHDLTAPVLEYRYAGPGAGRLGDAP